MDRCIFCQIVAGQASATIVYQDEQATAFRDIHPAASVHILIVPNRHLASINDLTEADEPVMGHLFTIARELAEQEGIAKDGYRLIINTGAWAGQIVHHLHVHLLGGQRIRPI